jgi:hypothetical protein
MSDFEQFFTNLGYRYGKRTIDDKVYHEVLDKETFRLLLQLEDKIPLEQFILDMRREDWFEPDYEIVACNDEVYNEIIEKIRNLKS